jgi:hypothetical protein
MTATTDPQTTNPFDEDYYIRGIESGKSNYANYHWMPDTTMSWAQHFKRYLSLRDGDHVLEIGAARGYYSYALRRLGLEAFGYDISEWAVANCHPPMVPYMSKHLNTHERYDVVWSKDVLEHVPRPALDALIKKVTAITGRKFFAIVPLCAVTNGQYVHEKEENDITHVNRWTLQDWLCFMHEAAPGWLVSGSYQYPGLKPGAYEVECGYGFLTLERI